MYSPAFVKDVSRSFILSSWEREKRVIFTNYRRLFNRFVEIFLFFKTINDHNVFHFLSCYNYDVILTVTSIEESRCVVASMTNGALKIGL